MIINSGTVPKAGWGQSPKVGGLASWGQTLKARGQSPKVSVDGTKTTAAGNRPSSFMQCQCGLDAASVHYFLSPC